MSKKTKLRDHFSVFKEPSESDFPNYPQCELLVNKQKRKFYGKKKNKLYLNDGDYIQISIFNSSYDRIGVQLEFNNNIEEKMVIINPGQKILLDRFVDTKKKIKYSTYIVDGNDDNVKESIKFNGNIILHFWKEKIQSYYYNINLPNNTNWSSGSYLTNTTISDAPFDLTTSSNCTFNDGLSCNSYQERKHKRKRFKMKETGRIEKGEKSKQKMKKVNFDPDYIFHTMKYKLLPFSEMKNKKKNLSEKPSSVTIDYHNNYKNTDHRIYCSNPLCGYRVRNRNWKYCPICGNQID